MTRDENPKANNDNEVLIPMIVDLDSADEHGMLAGLSKSDLRSGNIRICSSEDEAEGYCGYSK